MRHVRRFETKRGTASCHQCRALMDVIDEQSAPVSGHLFLSYASADRSLAFELSDALETAGMTVWIDRRDITSGDMWAAEITSAIRSCFAFALLCTESSLGSRNVRQELQLAWDHERAIVPIVPHPMEFPDEIAYFLQGRQWVELGGQGEQDWIASIARAVASTGSNHVGAKPNRSIRVESNLPIPPAEIVGRETQIAELAEMLLQRQSRLITLVGPGGVGKTRIALEAAWRIRDEGQIPVVFVGLASVREANLVLPTVAAVFGMNAENEEHFIQQLKAALRDQQLLLVLDNFEQVIAAAGFVSELLASLAGLQIIATSREPLRLRAEHIVDVRPLALPKPGEVDDVATISRNPAVELFEARARVANPRFVLTARNAGAVAEICRRLDGLPLAIELAASRVAVLNPEMMLQRMDKRLPLLTGGARDLPERQRTLRNTIAWSEELLSPEEQAVFRRLAVFVGGCSLESAIAVTAIPSRFANESDVFQALERLISHSLLRAESAPDGETRFWMLETIREFALERLQEAEELDEANERHAAWYLAMAESTETRLTGPDHGLWFERLRTEQDNLRAALSWSIEHQPEMGLRFSAELVEFWVSMSAHQEGVIWCERALGSATEGDPELVAAASLSAARLAYRTGNAGLSRQHAERALALFQAFGDEQGVMRAMAAFGSSFISEDESRVRTRLLNEALKRARIINDDHYVALIANNVAIREWNADALALFDEAIAIARRQGNDIGKTLFLMNQSELLAELGRYEEAVPLLREALESQSHLSHRNATEGLVAVAAVLLGVGGDPALAVRLHSAAAAEFLQTGSVTLEGEVDVRSVSRAALRQKLGDQVFDAAWSDGQRISLPAAVSEARHGLERWVNPDS